MLVKASHHIKYFSIGLIIVLLIRWILIVSVVFNAPVIPALRSIYTKLFHFFTSSFLSTCFQSEPGTAGIISALGGFPWICPTCWDRLKSLWLKDLSSPVKDRNWGDALRSQIRFYSVWLCALSVLTRKSFSFTFEAQMRTTSQEWKN